MAMDAVKLCDGQLTKSTSSCPLDEELVHLKKVCTNENIARGFETESNRISSLLNNFMIKTAFETKAYLDMHKIPSNNLVQVMFKRVQIVLRCYTQRIILLNAVISTQTMTDNRKISSGIYEKISQTSDVHVGEVAYRPDYCTLG
uniref:DNA-directed RNA polymerase n=1 Tax=Heterorhabditis bacteriophora TaxID=37862 RepID=A0A1I7X4R2_HETBA